MSQFDFPDWTRLDQWAAAPLEYLTNFGPGSPNYTFGPYNVTPYGALNVGLIQANNPAQFVTLTIEWYADAALTILVNTDRWITTLQATISDFVRCKGSFALVKIATTLNAVSGSFTITPFREWSDGDGRLAVPFLISRFGNVGAGLGVTVNASFVQTGPAILAVRSTATKWFAEVKLVEVGGGTTSVCVTDDLNGQEGNTVEFDMPAYFTQLTLFNKDAAVKSMSGVVVMRR